ncbi:MAG TPA: FAD-dependent oxidoreductase, partial [Candidatus Nanoarchaeia archaeon]|nr:FAD-dependent oxidoreductase [Candidatus Nanoarchaeia archaeon]
MPNFDIVIVGGGFCGVHVAKQIEKKLPKVTAALIDHKEFFEFTPAVPKIVTDPAHVNKIRVPYARLFKRVSFIKTELLSVSPARVRTKQGEFSFKYLVIATGSKYPAPAGTSALKSSEDALKLNQKLAGASSVMIIGGGLVGTELAGELVTKTDKKVTLLEPSQRILGRNTERASSWAQNYLTMNGCDIIFGERVNKASAKSVTTSHGVRKADVIVWCAGIKSESGFLEGSLAGEVDERKSIKVNEFLQVRNHPNIFCGGDINTVHEEKTAQNADRHARIIFHNIGVLISGKG